MALIGTISGSVSSGALTSTTAVSGTLIIADAAPSSFPTLASGVKLFVSGNKTELGADTPNAIFGGDTFVSGAFGTDSYIQMKPVTTSGSRPTPQRATSTPRVPPTTSTSPSTGIPTRTPPVCAGSKVSSRLVCFTVALSQQRTEQRLSA